ncbi:MAG: hypothetical protein MK074_07510 [Phycisphaerales bacterium]|nr:hypothetical protein [Phycisphaerales bacterium]
MKCIHACSLLLALILAPSTFGSALNAQQQASVLEEAQAAYVQGIELRSTDPSQSAKAFARSVDRFSVLVDDGIVNGPLLYDLGNAQVQAGEIGQGIASYLQAQALMPGDARIAENLAHARSKVRTRVQADGSEAVVDRLLFWHHQWSTGVRGTLFALVWCVLWGVLVVRCWRFVPGWRTTTCVSGVLSAALGVSLLSPWLGATSARGVLVQDDVIVRKGDAEAFAPRFEEPIHQGVEFRVLETRPNWLHIELLDGQDGWVPRDATEVIGAAGRRDAAMLCRPDGRPRVSSPSC